MKWKAEEASAVSELGLRREFLLGLARRRLREARCRGRQLGLVWLGQFFRAGRRSEILPPGFLGGLAA